jgi:hypothetical protein
MEDIGAFEAEAAAYAMVHRRRQCRSCFAY